MTTTRAAVVLLAALAAAAPAGRAFAQDFIPTAPNGILELEGGTSVIAQTGGFDLMVEATGRIENANHSFQYRSITLGGYYRVLRNLKVGAFYSLQAGVRHDDDWVANSAPPPAPGWVWQDTTGRYENVLMLDVSPRFLLDFLPGRNWVFLLKARYVFDVFDLQHSIVARPQLTYYWLRNRDPFLDFTASWQAWFPLNYGTTLIYESYPYLTVGCHVLPELLVQVGGAYKTTIWSTSQQVLASGQGPYQVAYGRWVMSLNVIFLLNP